MNASHLATETATTFCPASVSAGAKVVVIDDDVLTLRILKSQLGKSGYQVQTAASGAEGLELIDDETAVALVDLRMPELTGLDCLRHIRQHHPQVQVIILTGSHEVADAVDAMREGAFQFVTKPFDRKQLLVFVEKAVEASTVAHENRDLRESHSHNLPVRVIDAHGDVHGRLMQQVNRLAELDATVFIGGESGTGKSTVARMIHQNSRRAHKPFVTVNCASLPRDLLQSELFGHTRGAFTGAVKDRPGHAEVADGGTLFLDEIGDLPLDLQPKLLTFLQDRTVQRLGATESKKVDVRLIVATHRDLAAMCRENLFRPDLYFRLLVLNLELAPLRHRQNELHHIASGILAKICEQQGRPTLRFGEGVLDLMASHTWPGNIRELENVLERAAAFCDGGEIAPQDLLFSHVALERRQTNQSASSDGNSSVVSCDASEVHSRPLTEPAATYEGDIDASVTTAVESVDHGSPTNGLAGRTLKDIEREAIEQTLEAYGGNKAKSARVLGISEKTIYNKMRRLGISCGKADDESN